MLQFPTWKCCSERLHSYYMTDWWIIYWQKTTGWRFLISYHVHFPVPPHRRGLLIYFLPNKITNLTLVINLAISDKLVKSESCFGCHLALKSTDVFKELDKVPPLGTDGSLCTMLVVKIEVVMWYEFKNVSSGFNALWLIISKNTCSVVFLTIEECQALLTLMFPPAPPSGQGDDDQGIEEEEEAGSYY